MSTRPHDFDAGNPADNAPPAGEAGSQRDLLADIDALIQTLENHPDVEVRSRVTTLLAGVDAIHRTALTRLLEGIRSMAGDAFLNRLTGDPVIRLLLMSYDLIAVDRRIQTEDALDMVRPHLHAHGIDVELVDVIGGVIRVQLHGAAPEVQAAVRADIEVALAEGLIGFQELEIGGPRPAPARPAPLVSLSQYRRIRKPVHKEAVEAAAVAPGSMQAIELDGQSILVLNIAGDFHAVANHCGDSPLPLQFSTLEKNVLHCSWHGCRYDVRSGRRVDGGEERLHVLPVRVQDGIVHIALAVDSESEERP